MPRWFFFLASICALGRASPVELRRGPDRVRVEIDGALFTEYIFEGANHPYCYPVLAPDGTPLTRNFPMRREPGEDDDHPHQRSLWFAHSRINGIDFWNEGTSGGNAPKGKILPAAPPEISSGTVGRLRARDRWIAPDGTLCCTSDTTIEFGRTTNARIIDFTVTLIAPPDQPVRCGDNKDGIMAIRVAQWMTLPHKIDKAGAGGRDVGGNGHLVTANGFRDFAAWGKRADWCDYHAEREGKVYGIAIFDHPDNLRHPTWWMARNYGLLAANCLGWHDYEPAATAPAAGDHTIPAGERLTLRYRFYFHMGDEKVAGLAERYAEYARGP